MESLSAGFFFSLRNIIYYTEIVIYFENGMYPASTPLVESFFLQGLYYLSFNCNANFTKELGDNIYYYYWCYLSRIGRFHFVHFFFFCVCFCCNFTNMSQGNWENCFAFNNGSEKIQWDV